MSYQTSIRNQFEFLQRNWAISHSKTSVNGHDLVVGQHGFSTANRIAWLQWNGWEIQISVVGEWVFTSAGGYFFTPGISAITQIIQNNLNDINAL
ncbi:hypothetical protein [Persicitalea sp.]|uniref:hypothetical protein n=1 Tax=Persicitalea sp. TaxID=3100273 RepID=UPI003593257C